MCLPKKSLYTIVYNKTCGALSNGALRVYIALRFFSGEQYDRTSRYRHQQNS